MRILNIDGRFLVPALRRDGHDVLTVGPGPGHDLCLDSYLPLSGLMDFLAGKSFIPDFVIWCDQCRPPSVAGLETLPALTVGYSIDQYLNPWHYPYAAAFDLMLVAQKDYLGLFVQDDPGVQAGWFPLFCSEDADRDPALDGDWDFSRRDIPVGFVGTVEGSINKKRADFFNGFKKLHPIVIRQGRYQPVFSRSRIVLNQSAAGELNFRLFQAAACGAAVLNEDTKNGFWDIFTSGETILPGYRRGNAADAARIAREALADPGGLARIAAAGRDMVRESHSDTARVRELVGTARRMLAAKAQKRRLADPARVRSSLARAWFMLAGDGELPLNKAQRDLFQDLGRVYSEMPEG